MDKPEQPADEVTNTPLKSANTTPVELSARVIFRNLAIVTNLAVESKTITEKISFIPQLCQALIWINITNHA